MRNRFQVGPPCRVLVAAGLIGWLSAHAALAQRAADVGVQVPGFSNFGVNTTVVVPDRGAVPLGGERRAATGQSFFGTLPPQRDVGSATSSAAVRLHDPSASEADLQREVRERRATWSRGSVVARGLPQHVITIRTGSVTSVADLERDRALRAAARAQESAAYLLQAREAVEQGKSGVAAVYYGMAANRADDDRRRAIEAEARAVKAAAGRAATSGR